LTECGGCPSAADTTTRQQGWLSILLKENGYSGNRRKVASMLQLHLTDTSLCQRCRLLCRMQATLTVSFMYPRIQTNTHRILSNIGKTGSINKRKNQGCNYSILVSQKQFPFLCLHAYRMIENSFLLRISIKKGVAKAVFYFRYTSNQNHFINLFID